MSGQERNLYIDFIRGMVFMALMTAIEFLTFLVPLSFYYAQKEALLEFIWPYNEDEPFIQFSFY